MAEETEQVNIEKTPSMEQILESIRGAISGNETEKATEPVLELTEVVNSDGSISSLSNTNTSNDILNDIDNAIGIPTQDNQIQETTASNVEEPSAESVLKSQDEIDKLLEASNNINTKIEDKADEISIPVIPVSQNKIDDQVTKTSNEAIPQVPEIETKSDEKSVQIEQEKQEPNKKKRLISDETANASSEVLKTLVKKVSKPLSDNFGFRSGNTVEDLIIEMIKPYMSEWLDANLPNIVKHIVEKEVQKLIPKDED